MSRRPFSKLPDGQPATPEALPPFLYANELPYGKILKEQMARLITTR